MPAPGFSHRTALAFAFASLVVLLLAAPARAIDTSWASDADGSWGDPTAWTAGVPNARADTARLTQDLSTTRTITLGDPGFTVGQLHLQSSTAFGYTLAGAALNLDAGADAALVQLLGGTSAATHTISAPLNFYSSATFDIGSANTLQVTGPIAPSLPGVGLTKHGAGTLILSGTNTYDGGTTITAGTLGATTDAALGTGLVTLAGGTLQLYATAPPPAATRRIYLDAAGGTINCVGQVTSYLTLSGPGALTVSGTELELEGANAYTGGTKVLPGTTLMVLIDAALGAVPTTPTTSITFDGARLELQCDLSPNRGIRLESGGATISTYAHTIASVITGPGGLTLDDAVVTLTGNNTYAGGTFIQNGSIVTVTSDANLGSVPAAPGTNITLNFGVLRFGAGFALTPNRGICIVSQSTWDFDTNGFDATIGGIISGQALRKMGKGTLTLTGANTYANASGSAVEIAAGGLCVLADANLGSVPASPSNNIELDGGKLMFGASFDLAANRGVKFASSASSIDTNGFDVTIGGVVSGSRLKKAGSGTLSLTGTNTYTGGTIVNGGVLRVACDAALGAVPTTPATNITLSNNTTLQFGGAFDINANRYISLGAVGVTIDTNGFNGTVAFGSGELGSFRKVGDGTLTLTGADGGGVSIAAGALRASDGAERRLAELNDCFLHFGADSDRNIDRLVALYGEQVGAACAVYSRLEGGELRPVSTWNTPADFSKEPHSAGQICYEVFHGFKDQVIVIENLQQSEYMNTDPKVSRYGIKTYAGRTVSFSGTESGLLCAVYFDDKTLGEEDKKLLGIIASAIGVEEERKRALAALKDHEATLRSITGSARDAIIMIDSEGRTSFWNETATRIFGWNEAQALGNDLNALIMPGRYHDAFRREIIGSGDTTQAVVLKER